MALINVIGRQVQAGERYQPGEEYADILQDPYKCAFLIRTKLLDTHHTLCSYSF